MEERNLEIMIGWQLERKDGKNKHKVKRMRISLQEKRKRKI
jgi:hypothetical protein